MWEYGLSIRFSVDGNNKKKIEQIFLNYFWLIVENYFRHTVEIQNMFSFNSNILAKKETPAGKLVVFKRCLQFDAQRLLKK